MLQRILTACVLLPFVVYFIFLAHFKLFLLVSLLVVLMVQFEWLQLIARSHRFFQVCALFLMMVLFGLFIFYYPGSLHSPLIHWLVCLSLFVWLACLIQTTCYGFAMTPPFFHSFIFNAVVSFILLSSVATSMMVLRFNEGSAFFFYVLLLVIVSDSGAYFVGYFFGKHFLAPRISPKKTWEGFFGGVFFALLLSVFYAWFFDIAWVQIPLFFLQSFLIVVIGVYGDLYESMLKRLAGVKDSGRLLPGHGGLFDRLDGVLPALPLAYAFKYFFGV